MAHSLEELDRMQDEVRKMRHQCRRDLQAFEDMLRQRGVDVEAELASFLALPFATKRQAVAEFSRQLEVHPLWGLSAADLPELDVLSTSVSPHVSSNERGSEANVEMEQGLVSPGYRLHRLTADRI